jgi:predicted Zn-dependent protease
MDKRRILFRLVPIAIAALVVFFQYASSEKLTNEAGRTAHYALSTEQEEALGLQSYKQVLSESNLVTSGEEYDMVRRVAERLANAATSPATKNFRWQVSLVRSPQVNAFCLPGGKIVVYTGILKVAKGNTEAETEARLATVMGHEMAHATLRHGSERLLRQQAAQTLMSGAQVSVGDLSYEQQRAIMGALGAGAQYGVLLPFSRDHESEADKIGLLYMARAGYDPKESVEFWRSMAEASASSDKPPEFMSTHPSDATRINQLKQLLPAAEAEYRKTLPR